MIFNKEKTDFYDRLFDDCFRQYYQPLSYFAYTYLNDKDLAEDVVQTVFFNILKERKSFEDDSFHKHYLYKSVRNACLNELKRLSIHSDVVDRIKTEDVDPEEDADFFQAVVRAEVYREIMDAIESLPVACGQVFKMAYIQNYDNQEIADLLSISINTVKVQKNNAKKRLRFLLKDLYPLVFLFLGNC
ncbi:MAG: RNA polymerase sigma-70 factor [Bacteroidota bacterium]|nr:RNA polymerase sigma-70 factor [Bacteroidota bacterium]